MALSNGVRLALLLFSVFFAMVLHTSFQSAVSNVIKVVSGSGTKTNYALVSKPAILATVTGKSKQQTSRTGDSYVIAYCS